MDYCPVSESTGADLDEKIRSLQNCTGERSLQKAATMYVKLSIPSIAIARAALPFWNNFGGMMGDFVVVTT